MGNYYNAYILLWEIIFFVSFIKLHFVVCVFIVSHTTLGPPWSRVCKPRCGVTIGMEFFLSIIQYYRMEMHLFFWQVTVSNKIINEYTCILSQLLINFLWWTGVFSQFCNTAIKYLNVFLLSIFNFTAFFLQTIFSFVRLCVHIWMNCIHKTVKKHLIVPTMRIPTYNWTSNFTCRKWYNDNKYFLFILKG